MDPETKKALEQLKEEINEIWEKNKYLYAKWKSINTNLPGLCRLRCKIAPILGQYTLLDEKYNDLLQKIAEFVETAETTSTVSFLDIEQMWDFTAIEFYQLHENFQSLENIDKKEVNLLVAKGKAEQAALYTAALEQAVRASRLLEEALRGIQEIGSAMRPQTDVTQNQGTMVGIEQHAEGAQVPESAHDQESVQVEAEPHAAGDVQREKTLEAVAGASGAASQTSVSVADEGVVEAEPERDAKVAQASGGPLQELTVEEEAESQNEVGQTSGDAQAQGTIEVRPEQYAVGFHFSDATQIQGTIEVQTGPHAAEDHVSGETPKQEFIEVAQASGGPHQDGTVQAETETKTIVVISEDAQEPAGTELQVEVLQESDGAQDLGSAHEQPSTTLRSDPQAEVSEATNIGKKSVGTQTSASDQEQGITESEAEKDGE